MADNETIADIIAWLRKPREGENAYLTLWRDEIADRLEAAHRREHGDAAKLREALEELVANIEMRSSTFGLSVMVDTKTYLDAKTALAAPATTENSSAVGDCAKLREALKRIVAASIVAKNANAPEWILQRMADIFAMATTALSAPPRNCDRYTTFNDAIRALADKLGWHDGKWNSERYCILAQWLFAPATEKEGGAE